VYVTEVISGVNVKTSPRAVAVTALDGAKLRGSLQLLSPSNVRIPLLRKALGGEW